MKAEIPNSELQVKATLEMLKRKDLPMDAVLLLTIKLLELWNPLKKVVLTDSDSIEIIESAGEKTQIFLHNLRAECLQFPEDRAEIVERYLRVLLVTQDDDNVSAENVVVLVRDAEYRAFVSAEERETVTKHLVGDLWIIYAEDRPDSTSVLNLKAIKKLGIPSDDLLNLGTANVSRLLLNLEIDSHGEFHTLISENAVYLSSALLIDHIWDHAALMVDGEVVVGVPARDTVVFTGASNAEGLRLIREEVNFVFETGNHLISRTLLRRRQGRWSIFS